MAQKNNDLQKFSEVFKNSGSNMVTKSSPREPPGGFALPKNIDIVKIRLKIVSSGFLTRGAEILLHNIKTQYAPICKLKRV